MQCKLDFQGCNLSKKMNVPLKNNAVKLMAIMITNISDLIPFELSMPSPSLPVRAH